MIKAAEAARQPRPPLVTVAWLVALVGLVVLIYLPGIGGGFVFDDLPNIVDNTPLHVTTLLWTDWVAAIFSSPASSIQRPLSMLTFAINHYFTGLESEPMKWTNVGIHAINAVVLYGLMQSLFNARPASGAEVVSRSLSSQAALLVAALWAAHPINLMGVLFIVQRMESLSHLFVFAGLWAYTAGRMRQQIGQEGWLLILLGILPCTAIGLLAKESAVLLPLYALCIESLVFRFQSGVTAARDRRLIALFLIILVVPAVIGVGWLGASALHPSAYSGRAFTLGERLLTEGRVVVDYLQWTVYPDLTQLSLYHDDYSVSRGMLDPPSTAISFVLLAALAAIAWYVRRKRPLVSLGIAWFFAAQALTATFIPLELMFEHRNYFASAGICLAAADLLLLGRWTPTQRQLVSGLSLALVLLLAGATWLRAAEWAHPVRFAMTETAKHPESPRATYELARVLVILSGYGEHPKYLPAAREAIERARVAPGSSLMPEQAALILAARTGQPLQSMWWRSAERKLREQPITPQGLGALNALIKCVQIDKCKFPVNDMLSLFQAALSRGDHPEVLNLYANYASVPLGDVSLATRLWKEAIHLKPSEPQYRVNLAYLSIAVRDFPEARRQIAALRAYGKLGQGESTALELERALSQAVNLDQAGVAR